MAHKNVRVCVLRAMNRTIAPISDAACNEMIISGPFALLTYWSGNTNGYLSFNGSALQPWVDIMIAVGDDDESVATKAYKATRAVTGSDLSAFDSFIVLVHPGTDMAGKGLVGKAVNIQEAGGKGAAILPVMAGTHSFACHEVGHTLGFKHTFGLLNNGIEYDAEPPYAVSTVYGDPYDIMSAESFGSHTADPHGLQWSGDPTFTIPLPAGWPGSTWSKAACGPARAAVHHWNPDAVPDFFVRQLPFPHQGQPHRVRISSTGAGLQDPQLIVLHVDGEPADGRSRVYLEYRSSDGWDQGLATQGSNLSRRGLVVHTLDYVSEISEVGVFYRGTIRVPLQEDTDLWPFATPLVVTVLEADPNELFIDVEIATSAARSVHLDPRTTAELVETTDEHPIVTPCGDHLVSATRRWVTSWFYTVGTHGYGTYGNYAIVPATSSPVISWNVNGVDLPPPFPTAAFPSGAPGQFNVPTAAGPLTLTFATLQDPAALMLSDDGKATVQLSVTVTATETDGTFELSAAGSFDTIGTLTGLTEGDHDILNRCLQSLGVGSVGQLSKLRELALALSVAGAVPSAADAQQAVVDALAVQAAQQPTAATVRDLADGQHTLAVRQTEAARNTAAAASAESSIANYLRTVQLMPADAAACIEQLLELAVEMSHHLLPVPAADAQVAGIDLWQRLTPPSLTDAKQLSDYADALHNLTARLGDAGRLTEADTQGHAAIAAYLQAAAQVGADRSRLEHELQVLAGVLRPFGLTTTADAAQQAAAQLITED